MEASQADKNVFGADVKLHPVTHMPLESGIGALPDDEQARMHCNMIEANGDKDAADAMRAKLNPSPEPDEEIHFQAEGLDE